METFGFHLLDCVLPKMPYNNFVNFIQYRRIIMSRRFTITCFTAIFMILATNIFTSNVKTQSTTTNRKDENGTILLSEAVPDLFDENIGIDSFTTLS